MSAHRAVVEAHIIFRSGRLELHTSVDPVPAGAHVRLELGPLNRYGWRLACALQAMSRAASFEVSGGERPDVRAQVAAFLIAGGMQPTSIEGVRRQKLTQVSLERPQPRASREERRWEQT